MKKYLYFFLIVISLVLVFNTNSYSKPKVEITGTVYQWDDNMPWVRSEINVWKADAKAEVIDKKPIAPFEGCPVKLIYIRELDSLNEPEAKRTEIEGISDSDGNFKIIADLPPAGFESAIISMKDGYIGTLMNLGRFFKSPDKSIDLKANIFMVLRVPKKPAK